MTDAPEPAGGPLPWKDAFPPLLLCAILLGAGLAAGFFQEEPDSDEPVYLAMAEAWAREGKAPYRDFFFAHPPGLLAPAAALFAVAPPSIRLARAVPVLSTIALFFLVLACARLVEKRAALPGATIFAATLFVLSPAVHLVGASYLGMNCSAALVLGSALLLLSRRPFAAGLAAGLSLLVRLSTLPAVLVLAVASFAREAPARPDGPEEAAPPSPRPAAAGGASSAEGPDAPRPVASNPASRRGGPAYLAGLALGLSPLLLFLFTPGFLDQVFLFHVRKESMDLPSRAWVLLKIAYEEKALLFAIALAFLPFGRREPRVFLWAGLLGAAFMAAQKVVWPYYVHVAVPFLCIAGAAGIARLLRGRLRGPVLLVPNLALLLAVGALNVFVILPRYRPDETLLPLVGKAEALAGPSGRVLDLSGGGKGCYLACKSGLTVSGGLFDMSLHRVRHGSLTPSSLAEEIRSGPDLILTEWEAGGRTILWSRLPQVRKALLGLRGGSGGFRPADFLLRANDLSLVILWVPAGRGNPEPPPEFTDSKEADAEVWTVASGEDRRSRKSPLRGAFGMGDDAFFGALLDLPAGPGTVAALGSFIPPAPGLPRWLAEDAREGRPIESRVWAQPGKDRLFVETVYADAPFEPLSFAEARFDPATGRLLSFRALGEGGRGLIPVVSMQTAPGGR